MFEKHLWWKSDILSKDAGHFASKNQLPGLSVNGTLTENGLIYTLQVKHTAILVFCIRMFDLSTTFKLFPKYSCDTVNLKIDSKL